MDENQEEATEGSRDEVALRQAQDELRRVDQVVSKLTGLTSHWNGHVELLTDADWRGTKPFPCHIRLDAARQEQDVRWRTQIHEILHAHSVGYTRYAFDTFPGWEEGVVEQLQRLLRPQVLMQLNLVIPASVFEVEEATHEFNAYIAALESLRVLLQRPGESEATFYVALLATPLDQRMNRVMAQGKQMPPPEAATFLRTFAAASATLRHKRRP